MKSKAAVLTIAQWCKNILGANCQAHLNTVKVDAAGSKSDIHTSKVHYIFRMGKPYLWVHEGDLHNTNVIIDGRASLSVSKVVPGPLMGLLRSIKKMPGLVALTGDLMPLKDDKVQLITESLKETILTEYQKMSEVSYAVSALLSSASDDCKPRSEILHEILDHSENYAVYKFNIRSCTFVDSSGSTHDLELQNIDVPKTDILLSFSTKLVDGINQNSARRRALMLFCFEHYNATCRDALMLSIDHKGFDVLGRVPEGETEDGTSQQFVWKEFRFTFKEEASDIESFCRLLVEFEEEILETVKRYSGLG